MQFGDYTTPRARAGGVILMHGTGPHAFEALTGICKALTYWGLALPYSRKSSGAKQRTMSRLLLPTAAASPMDPSQSPRVFRLMSVGAARLRP